jgi:hypothetical protein
MLRRVLGTLAAVALAVSVGGCRNHCVEYCEKLRECVDANLNVDRCVRACSDYRDESAARADRVEDCAVCIERNPMCSETGACFSQCFGVPNG